MDQIQYIMSDSNINNEFFYPYLNVHNFKFFKNIIIININNTLWVRFDDIEKYFPNNTIDLIEFVLNMDSENIKFLKQLAEVPFWDTNTDIYIHEFEFMVLMIYSGISNLTEILNFLQNIKTKRLDKIFNNSIIKNNLINLINSDYSYNIQFNNEYNYIITKYINRFTIKCLETDKTLIFLSV